MDITQISLVIFASENGRDGWRPVSPDQVPEWLKAPDNIARMVSGEECMRADEGEKGSLWYRAVPAAEYEEFAQQLQEQHDLKRLH